MQNLILDTNIYGLIVVDLNREKVRVSIEKKKSAIVYGLPLIRKELRDTPKNIRVRGTKLRNYLLEIYDEITKNHTLKSINEAEKLAISYFNVYKEMYPLLHYFFFFGLEDKFFTLGSVIFENKKR